MDYFFYPLIVFGSDLFLDFLATISLVNVFPVSEESYLMACRMCVIAIGLMI